MHFARQQFIVMFFFFPNEFPIFIFHVSLLKARNIVHFGSSSREKAAKAYPRPKAELLEVTACFVTTSKTL